LLFWDVQGKKQNPSGASATVGTEWANHKVKFGWRVTGIWPPGTDGTHINVVEESKDNKLLATGDDYGLVNIYRNPCREYKDPKSKNGKMKNPPARSYRGHSEHVTKIRFHGFGEYMVSTGGQDKTVIQWKRI